MHQVTVENIEKAVAIIDHYTDQQFADSNQKLSIEQCYLFDYMLYGFHEDGHEIGSYVVYYMLIVIQAVHEQNLRLRMVNYQDLTQDEALYTDTIETFFATDNMDVLDEYTGQPNLVRFMFHEISTPDDDGTEMDDEIAVQLLMMMVFFIRHISQVIEA